MHWDKFFISVNLKFSQNMGHLTLPGGPNIVKYSSFSNVQSTEHLLDSSFFNPVSNSKEMFSKLVFASFSVFRCKEDLHHHFYHWSCQLNEHHLNSVLKAYDPSFWLGITSTGSIAFEQLALMKTPILTSLSWHTILLILWKYCHFVIFSFVATSCLSTESSCITCR